MAEQILILLDTAVDYQDVNPDIPNPSEYPTLTHVRIVNIKTEVDRDLDSKDGYIECWFAYGYMNTGIFYEARGIDGIYILFESMSLIRFFPGGIQYYGLQDKYEAKLTKDRKCLILFLCRSNN